MFKKIKAWWKNKMFDRDINNLFKEPPKRIVIHFGYRPICGKYKKGNYVSMEIKKVTCKKCRKKLELENV